MSAAANRIALDLGLLNSVEFRPGGFEENIIGGRVLNSVDDLTVGLVAMF